MKLRAAIVGAGLQGKRRAQALVGTGAEVVAITANHLDGARALAASMGCEAGQGWQEVVQRPDVDAVIVCTPPDSHAEITLAALASGKHVLCEKPLSRTVEEGEAMVEAARKTGLVLKCGFNHRHHPAVLKAKELFDGGRIGRPVFLRSTYGICGRAGYEREWRADVRVVSGGQLMEQGIHVIDLFRWFLGELTGVAGFVETNYWPIRPLEDNAFVVFRTPDGVMASLHSSLTQWKNVFRFEVFGEEGYLIVDGLGGGYGTERLTTGRRIFDAPFTDETTEFRGGDSSWRAEWDEFTAAIEQGREPIGNGVDGLEALRLVFAAYAAGSNLRQSGHRA